MYIINIQTLSDKDYAKALPDDYVINVKATEMRKCIIQVAKKQENDRSKVYHMHTSKFKETHLDTIECSVEYSISPTGHVELVSMVEPAGELTGALTEITGRMFHRTQKRALQLESEKRNERRSMKSEAEAEAETEAEAEA